MAGVLKIERRTYHGLQNSEWKTFIEDMNGKEIMMKTVPSLTKYPLKLFYKKTVGDIVNLVRSKKLVPEDAIQAFIKDVEAL